MQGEVYRPSIDTGRHFHSKSKREEKELGYELTKPNETKVAMQPRRIILFKVIDSIHSLLAYL
jgi:hypothetical protein